jgi:hypothetical protein
MVEISKNYTKREATSTGRGKTVISENYYQFQLSVLILNTQGVYFETAPFLVTIEKVTKLDTGERGENLSIKSKFC